MACSIEVLFTPAEFRALCDRDLKPTVCVVLDVLRATSTFVTALANGAAAIIPVAEISEALKLRRERPDVLLAGERDGLKIGAALTGGVEFDLGNSPREFTSVKVAGKTVVSTTTNGTRALRACAGARRVLVGSFLNLSATADAIARRQPEHLLVICAGTGEGAALEDVLAAGALCDLLASTLRATEPQDSAEIARRVFLRAQGDLPGAVRQARNARRLLAYADLRDDVEFCLQKNRFALVAASDAAGTIRKEICG
ncbi:MAG: 2-phosphosulfolactate phosphatase [Verrucomicrobia bacterium]|nr:2-phosphosulfolactate phosphatase [Verrucomicrobiota bacterium]